MVDLFYYKTVEDQEKQQAPEMVKAEAENKDDKDWDAEKATEEWSTPLE
jgi:hypothetical protein